MGLARTLLIILAVYWGIRLFYRYVMPFLLKYFIGYLGKKAQENMGARGFDTSGFQNQYEEPVAGNEKVTIKKTTTQQSQKKSMDDVGDYVDFEELE